ncbi:RlpA-like double-psi beta-barrel-protein domain-containing protein-containing protein [Tricladium varicosporioides]|nr:RlpA-like double-psi beta-barrel-protein domain-containing protein-containing protein [Hymenoscyphus varicosporioides]
MRFESIFILALSACGAIAAPTSPNENVLEARAKQGLGTVYLQEGGYGSCGNKNPDSSLIVALSNTYMQSKANSPYCGRKVKITNTGSNSGTGGKGKSVTATVADTCPSCDAGHVDLSLGAWNALTGNAAYGTINISWDFV